MSASRTYLDYNASAPLIEEARAAIIAALAYDGNPSSVHAEGRAARGVIETAREKVAALINAKPSEIVFTSGATEANVWALDQGWDTIFCAPVEHDSVLAPARAAGAKQIEAPVDTTGIVDLAALAASLGAAASGRRLLTLQMANNETGVLQPVGEAVALAREQGVLVHTDAVQAAGRIDIDVRALGVDFLSLSSHKLGGPKGIGALFVRDGIEPKPLIRGGGQERRRRSGTENVAAIAGFGSAAEVAKRELANIARIAHLRDTLEQGVVHAAANTILIGKNAPRLANTASISVPGKAAETLVIKFDLKGIAVSAGSACSSGKVGASHVLTAMGLAPEVARSAIRVSIGRGTTEDDIAAFLAAFGEIASAGALAA
jgi:cysteine desulfurase